MALYFRARLGILSVFLSQVVFPASAQTPDTTMAPLREVHADGEKLLSEARYNFQTRFAGVLVTYHVQEAPRIPAYFDNIPWFADSELADAIRARLPFFDGTLPEAGAAVDQAGEAVKALLSSHGLQVSLDHLVIANPIGKPYSRMTIDLFLSEAIKPIYLQQGYLRAKLGPPEVRLTGNPNQKLPEQIPVYAPIVPGAVYHWKEVHWTGNTLVSQFTLIDLLGVKPGEVADGMKVEAGWDRVREEYGRHGYLEAKVNPVAAYDDQAHTVSYAVSIQEGAQYHFGKMVLTGLSPAAERKLHAAWPIAAGDIFDKAKYEEILDKLQTHEEQIFGELPLHYETVGHWLQTDAAKATVDVLLDFK